MPFENIFGKGGSAGNQHFLLFLQCFLPINDKLCHLSHINPFPNDKFWTLPKLKDFADNNFRFDENGRKLSKRVENTVEKEKLLVTSNFSFSHSVFKRHVLQIRKNQGLFGKGLKL